ncbi:hypothetical protein CEXT_762901 [Caerostris extrusa]|uniref:Uncharacterized protein n=1 Tax=Caerostris extrusa TaxID=172846 RepID=A0AAV4X7V3_CAEEX|nr:hypothetical protein CEXT_762901 [Caerostris extrusa]
MSNNAGASETFWFVLEHMREGSSVPTYVCHDDSFIVTRKNSYHSTSGGNLQMSHDDLSSASSEIVSGTSSYLVTCRSRYIFRGLSTFSAKDSQIPPSCMNGVESIFCRMPIYHISKALETM